MKLRMLASISKLPIHWGRDAAIALPSWQSLVVGLRIGPAIKLLVWTALPVGGVLLFAG